MFAASSVSFSQSLGYEDLAILFSQNDNNGTARFTSMSGAFGALGGDISSLNINPVLIISVTNSPVSPPSLVISAKRFWEIFSFQNYYNL